MFFSHHMFMPKQDAKNGLQEKGVEGGVQITFQ